MFNFNIFKRYFFVEYSKTVLNVTLMFMALGIILNIFEEVNFFKDHGVGFLLPLSLTFLKVLEQNKRFSNLYSIISQFININAYNRGDVLADITSAEELNDEQRKNIKEQLKNTLGKKLSLKFIVDKKIIGGLVVKVGSKMIDTSLANKINKLKIAMKGA